jgi:hypothetical protein
LGNTVSNLLTEKIASEYLQESFIASPWAFGFNVCVAAGLWVTLVVASWLG